MLLHLHSHRINNLDNQGTKPLLCLFSCCRHEDGTIAFLDIVALKYGFDCLAGIAGDIDAVCNHTFSITRYTYQSMLKLCHYNCQPLCQIYSENDYSDAIRQGPVINFNLLDAKGKFIGYSQVFRM